MKIWLSRVDARQSKESAGGLRGRDDQRGLVGAGRGGRVGEGAQE